MTRLRRLDHARELMDEPDIERDQLARALDDVAAVNRWLGGRRALLRHLPALLPTDRPATLLDAGTGSADLPRAILQWAERNGRDLRITAADLHPATLEIARERSRHFTDAPASAAICPEALAPSDGSAGPTTVRLAFQLADVRRLPFPDDSFDIALLSMTLHHLEGDDRVTALRELARVARKAVLVGELERSWPAYIGARVLAATLWRRSPITRHDGPLSIRRAFTPAELLELARRAGLPEARVHRHRCFRLVMVGEAGT